jgi:hypothetical protein
VVGESGKEILGLEPADVMVRWSADGISILTYQSADRKTLWIARVDVTTGKRQVLKEWTPADRAGVTGDDSAGISEDGKTIVYSSNRVVGHLYSVNGLK